MIFLYEGQWIVNTKKIDFWHKKRVPTIRWLVIIRAGSEERFNQFHVIYHICFDNKQ